MYWQIINTNDVNKKKEIDNLSANNSFDLYHLVGMNNYNLAAERRQSWILKSLSTATATHLLKKKHL